MARFPRIPKYRKHASGQARVTLGGQDFLLGPFNSPESHEAYRRLIAEWAARPANLPASPVREPLSLNALILAYWDHAAVYYNFANSRRGYEACLRTALRLVRQLYGRSAAADFGPLALKAFRARMVDKGWSRTYINAQIDRVRRMFRWAAGEELLPVAVYESLRAVPGLRAGKSAARETARVRPVPAADIEAALPHMPPAVRAMVRFQLLTGCRPAEACLLRSRDLDRSEPSCWGYRPGSDQGPHGAHKTAHRGHDRLILVGPRAQEILAPFLGVAADAYCFSPTRSEQERHAARRVRRRVKLWPSHLCRKKAPDRRGPVPVVR